MKVYRITSTLYSKDMSGKGAALYGGRWNEKEWPMLYTSSSRALCILELIVHSKEMLMYNNFSMLEIEIPEGEGLGVIMKAQQLPKKWNQQQIITQEIGTKFLKTGKHLYMKVPSVIVPEEYNIVINPLHVRREDLKISLVEAYSLDERLLNRY